MPRLIDTHCHLDFENFDEDREEVISRASDMGVGAIIVPAIDLQNCKKVLRIAESHPNIYAAVGIHPNSSKEWQNDDLIQLKELAQHDKVVAIGEIGLDYYRNFSPQDTQRDAFNQQLDLAIELNLPVIIHNREADDDILSILARKKNDSDRVTGVLHSFSTRVEVARSAVIMGYYIGFTGPITFRKAHDVRAVSASLPMDRILIETDSPFLAPEPRRGRRNEPGFVRFVAEKLAEVRGLSFDEIAYRTTQNAERLFNL